MALDVCNDFNLKYFDITCFIILAIIVILIFYLIFYRKTKRFIFGLKIMSSVLAVTTVFAFISFIAFDKFFSLNGCFCALEKSNIKDESILPNIVSNKVVVVGDSRMEFIENNRQYLNIPKDFIFIAKAGASISWFKSVAYSKIIETLDNRNTAYKYHVVINMGVNDLNIVDTVNSRALEYFKLYKSLANQYENVEFYFMSVNPVQDKYMYTKDMADMRNDEIMIFNGIMHKLLEKNDLANMHYCDSYNNIHFETYDGLHYDNPTNQLILNYIANKCVIYNTKRAI